VSRLTPNCNFPVENFPPSNVHRPQQGESHDELLGDVQDGDAQRGHHIHGLVIGDQGFESRNEKQEE
jgi:hypothetical protein